MDPWELVEAQSQPTSAVGNTSNQTVEITVEAPKKNHEIPSCPRHVKLKPILLIDSK